MILVMCSPRIQAKRSRVNLGQGRFLLETLGPRSPNIPQSWLGLDPSQPSFQHWDPLKSCKCVYSVYKAFFFFY